MCKVLQWRITVGLLYEKAYIKPVMNQFVALSHKNLYNIPLLSLCDTNVKAAVIPCLYTSDFCEDGWVQVET